MLNPKELYYYYTVDPCEGGGLDFFKRPQSDVGRGTPYDLPRLSNFLKQLKYPCYTKAPYSRKLPSEDPLGIKDTGKRKLCLSYKFLQRLDVEAFTEIQPDIQSGTSHAVRNACDIMRACSLEEKKNYKDWEHRGATEYMQHFGANFITDCLMTLGPDLIPEFKAVYERWTGCGDLDCLPAWKNAGGGSALGSPAFKCQQKGDAAGEECSPCKKCPEDNKEDPCCKATTCEAKMELCCTDVVGERNGQFRVGMGSRTFYDITPDEINLPTEEYPLIHIGLLKRKSYDGYVNLLNNTGQSFYSCPGDLMLKYFQKINNYDYVNDTTTAKKTGLSIDRARTISLVYFLDPNEIVSSIKDLLYNGYGVVIMTNIGFPNYRDSTGLSYPDRIWYHSYAIIGYDDRKVDYDECVYLLANSWGKWNDGGHPSWGPIPDGSFLVTESHLKCMVRLFRSDKKPCRKIYDRINDEETGCEGERNDSCAPWDCAKNQGAAGMVFALSMKDGFPKQELNFNQFYKVRENTYEPNLTLYFNGSEEESQ